MVILSDLFTYHFCDAIKIDNTPGQKIPTDYLYICNRADILSGQNRNFMKSDNKNLSSHIEK